MMTMREYRDARKTPNAWPGGYPLYFVMEDGGAMCHACGKSAWRTIVRTWNTPRAGWRPEAIDVNWEDTELVCCHCGKQIESAYGD